MINVYAWHTATRRPGETSLVICTGILADSGYDVLLVSGQSGGVLGGQSYVPPAGFDTLL